MWTYAGGRALRALLVIVVATFGTLALLRLSSGSVAYVILGENATPEAVVRLEQELGLDRSIFASYGQWLGGAVQGDLGTSPLTGRPILPAILERLPVTLELAAVALVLSLAIAVPLAVAAASRPDSWFDRLSTFLASSALSIPAFVAGPVLVYVFAVQLQLLPSGGWRSLSDGVGMNLRSVLLPAAAIALSEAAAFQRLLRTDLRTTLREDYIEAARSRGLTRPYVMWRHALRPSSFSVLTLAGIVFGRLLGGAIVVETLFGLPGLGSLIITSITSRDVAVVQGAVCFIVVAYVVVNALVDVTYGLLDPRVRTRTVR